MIFLSLIFFVFFCTVTWSEKIVRLLDIISANWAIHLWVELKLPFASTIVYVLFFSILHKVKLYELAKRSFLLRTVSIWICGPISRGSFLLCPWTMPCACQPSLSLHGKSLSLIKLVRRHILLAQVIFHANSTRARVEYWPRSIPLRSHLIVMLICFCTT